MGKSNAGVSPNVEKAVKNVKDDVKQQLEKLNQLEAAIENEKEKLTKESKKDNNKAKIHDKNIP